MNKIELGWQYGPVHSFEIHFQILLTQTCENRLVTFSHSLMCGEVSELD